MTEFWPGAQAAADEFRLRLERLRWASINGDLPGVFAEERRRIDAELERLKRGTESSGQAGREGDEEVDRPAPAG